MHTSTSACRTDTDPAKKPSRAVPRLVSWCFSNDDIRNIGAVEEHLANITVCRACGQRLPLVESSVLTPGGRQVACAQPEDEKRPAKYVSLCGQPSNSQ